ncbi:hypothetical protein [Paraliomyxa miuraensis]|uniref:hypothetical protein n=1 Tax=Paraliomyxa miuraensis TaxID=376150 RepID=UPI002253CBE0|nr:hypothetical protein [Paraliomyxa miuraensis]MCX4247711.1 hypothetical protein [Paraliomyxa miuraensis]
MEEPSAKASRAPLWRRLGALVLRDAVRAQGAGVALVLLPLVYLFREWPPWVIRDTLHALPDGERAGVLAMAHAGYGLATAPLHRQLLASERLRWWWALPLPAGWWRGLHLWHLGLLGAPWLGAIVYGVLGLVPRAGGLEAITSGVAFGALSIAWPVALVSVLDRHVAWRGLVVLGWAGSVAVAVMVPGPIALCLAAPGLGLAVRRLGRPMPEARARASGVAGGHPVLALARLCWLAVRRRDGVAVAWGVAVQLGAVALGGLALSHVGTTEPETARALLRGLAVVAATVGTAVVLRASRLVHGERPWMDSWGIDPRHERRARWLLAACGVLPAFVLGALWLPWVGPSPSSLGAGWSLQLGLATIWAASTTTRMSFSLEAERRLQDSRLPRHLLWMAAALLLVGVAGSVLVLLPWAAVELWRSPASRRLLETAHRDDHRS